MALYFTDDLEIVSAQWDSIHNAVQKRREELQLEPSLSEKKKVHKIVIDFAKQNKRKVYGGFAINLLINDKNPDDAIYTSDDVPDIDMYSPDPISDLMKICNLMAKDGHKFVRGTEAQHPETYSIFIDKKLYCDISYVPRNVYNKMPFKEINGIQVIHPTFMTIDYLRMLSDPLLSYWRFNTDDLKGFKRFVLLQKHYPLPHNDSPINISGSTPKLDIVLDVIQKFITDRESLINIGFYAYNHFLKESQIVQNKNIGKQYKYLAVPYYEMISSNYRTDFFDLIAQLKNIDTIDASEITHTEFYPFFQFTGHSVEIYLKGDLVAKIYNNNKKCHPYRKVNATVFANKTFTEPKKGSAIIGTFQVTLLYALINVMKARTDNAKDLVNLYYVIISHLSDMRNYYFDKTKKTILDESLFKDFVIDCIGDTITPDRQRKLMIEARKKKNKRLSFRYEPDEGIKEPESNFYFANGSGNAINNHKNLKLGDAYKEDEIEEIDDTSDDDHKSDK